MKGTSVSTIRRNSLFLFLAWPFFTLIYAIRNYQANWAKDIIWLFVVFHGLTITIHDVGEEKRDANRYRDKFVKMAAKSVTFQNITSLFYTEDEDTQYVDVLELIIIYIVSRFSANYHVLFAVFGLIFGYFYSRNIWYLIEKAGGKLARENIPIIFTFAFIVGFWEINGFRFYTAVHLFFYGALPYLLEGNKKRLWFSAIAMLMHFSFVAPVGILLIYLLLRNRTNVYFALFITTFFVKELNVGQVGEFLSNNLPEIFLPRVKNYTSDAYLEVLDVLSSRGNWYIKLYDDALKWSVVSFLIVIFMTGKGFLKKYNGLQNLFSFTLLFYSFANIFALMPSGGRFIALANLFSVAIIFMYVQFAPRVKLLRRVILLALPALGLFSIVSVRVAIDTMGFFSILGNPILSSFIDADITIIEVVKNLLGIKI